MIRRRTILCLAGLTVLASADLDDENSFDEPKKVAPVSSSVSGVGPELTYTFRPYSLTVLRPGRGN